MTRCWKFWGERLNEEGKGCKAVDYKSIKIGIHPTIVSTELPYFVSLGLIEKDRKGTYLVNSKAIEFVDNLNWNKEVEAKMILRSTIQNSWFCDLTSKILKGLEVP